MIKKFVCSLFGINNSEKATLQTSEDNMVTSYNVNIEKQELPTTTQDSFDRIVKQNSDVVSGYTYSTALDNLCCPECWPLDKVVFPPDRDKCPKLPRHTGCRCLLMPKLKSFRELGVDWDDFKEVERPWTIREVQTTYKRNPNKKLKNPKRTILQYGHFAGSAEEWIRTLPAELQRTFFKSELAYQLWVKGRIKAIDLLNPETWELRSDKELEELFC